MALLALGLAGCGDGAALDRMARGEVGRAVEARSGDVLVLDSGLIVRLAGLDVPRWGEPGADLARAALDRQATGKRVRLFYGGKRRDDYGRALAQVRLADNGVWLQGVMLNDGLARVRPYPDNRPMAQAMLAHEANARAAKRGLWASVWRVLLPQEVDRTANGFQIVEGQIARVTPTRAGVYLDFASSASGFAAFIPSQAVAAISSSGRAPESLQGRLVRVRGVIGWDGLMRIDAPEQIELLRQR
jgi:endonuclease YncB( thermonuclease family)